jgi:DNA ligase-associated metallophosphoesterase
MQEITLQDEQLHLLPERAVWWPAQRAIMLSDVHWGKSAHFRKHGIPMPGGTQRQDAMRLAGLLRRHRAERLIIAGDLFHSKHNSEVDDFAHWRSAHSALHIHFIMGNHDILPASFYHSINLEIAQEGLALGPFYITHDDAQYERLYTIHGHIHPGVSVPGAGTYPCFAIGAHAMVLPAFGKFTGCKRVALAHYRSVYVVGEEKVMQLK